METVSFLLGFEEIWRMASFISSNREVSPSNADILKELSRIKFTDIGVSILYPVFAAGWNKIRATKIGSKKRVTGTNTVGTQKFRINCLITAS